MQIIQTDISLKEDIFQMSFNHAVHTASTSTKTYLGRRAAKKQNEITTAASSHWPPHMHATNTDVKKAATSALKQRQKHAPPTHTEQSEDTDRDRKGGTPGKVEYHNNT